MVSSSDRAKNLESIDISRFVERDLAGKPVSEFWQWAISCADDDDNPTELTFDEVYAFLPFTEEALPFFEEAKRRARLFAPSAAFASLSYGHTGNLLNRSGDEIAALLQTHYRQAYDLSAPRGLPRNPDAVARLHHLITQIEAFAKTDRSFAEKVDRVDIFSIVLLAHPTLPPGDRAQLHQFILGEIDAPPILQKQVQRTLKTWRDYQQGTTVQLASTTEDQTETMVELFLEWHVGDHLDTLAQQHYCPSLEAGAKAMFRKDKDMEAVAMVPRSSVSGLIAALQSHIVRTVLTQNSTKPGVEEEKRNEDLFFAYISEHLFHCRGKWTKENYGPLISALSFGAIPEFLADSFIQIQLAATTPFQLDDAVTRWMILEKFEGEVRTFFDQLKQWRALGRNQEKAKPTEAQTFFGALVAAYLKISTLLREVPQWTRVQGLGEIPYPTLLASLRKVEKEKGLTLAPLRWKDPTSGQPRNLTWREVQNNGPVIEVATEDLPSDVLVVLQNLSVEGNPVWPVVREQIPVVYLVDANKIKQDGLAGMVGHGLPSAIIVWNIWTRGVSGILNGPIISLLAHEARHNDFFRRHFAKDLGERRGEIEHLEVYMYTRKVLESYERYQEGHNPRWRRESFDDEAVQLLKGDVTAEIRHLKEVLGIADLDDAAVWELLQQDIGRLVKTVTER